MVTPCLPFRLILSSLSRVMPGDFSRTSIAVEPALEGEASTLMTMRSAFCSIRGFLPTTATDWRLLELEASTRGVSDWLLWAADSSIGPDQAELCPIVLADTRYLPPGRRSKVK